MERRSRRVQYLVTLCLSLGFVTIGASSAWPSPVIPKFKRNETSVDINDTGISWMVAVNPIGFIVGSFITRFTSDRLGRRATILASAPLHAVGSIIAAFALKGWMLCITLFLWSCCTGMMSTVVGIYVAEIADNDLRGTLQLFTRFAFNFGNLLVMSTGPSLSYEVINYLMVLLPLCTLVACWWIPETPYYLIKEGKLIEAKKELRMLRGYIDETVLSTLSFYASGSYQRVLGASAHHKMHQVSVSNCMRAVTHALNNDHFRRKYIHFPQTREERNVIKCGFYQKFNMPGVLGCIDGTHIAIVRPSDYEERFFNRKRYHSINAQITLDEELTTLQANVKNEMRHSSTAIELFFGKQYRRAIIVAAGIKLTQIMTGGASIRQYLGEIMIESRLDKKHEQTVFILFGVITSAVSMASSCLVDRMGRRPLLISSYLGTGFSLVIAGVYFFLLDVIHIEHNSLSIYGFIPFVGIILSSVVSTFGFVALSSVIPAEIFPLNVKCVAMTSLNVFGGILGFIVGKGYQNIKDWLGGLHGVFWIFAAVAFFGALFTIFVVPETGGLSLNDIQKVFQGVSYNEVSEKDQVVPLNADAGKEEVYKSEGTELVELTKTVT